MKFALGQQVLLLVGLAHREVVVTGRSEYLRGATQYLVEDLDPDSKRGTFWIEEPGLLPKSEKGVEGPTATASYSDDKKDEDRNRLTRDLWVRHGLDYYDPKTHSVVRTSGGRVDFKDAPRDWTPAKDAKPTSRGFFIGDRVIHPHYGGGLVTDNVNGHTEVRFYEQDVRTVFIGVRNDELRLASIAESAEAYPSEAAAIEKAVRDAIADGAVAGLGKMVDQVLKEVRQARPLTDIMTDVASAVGTAKCEAFAEGLLPGELVQVDGFLERVLTVFADRGYSANLSFHKPDPTPDLASGSQAE